MSDIVCAGFGGQGVLTMGLILAKTGMDNGKNVTWIPSYGSEMRGGTANCNIKISDEEISTPFIRNIDVLVAMNTPSLAKFESFLNPGALLVVNTSIVKDYEFRKDIKIVSVKATDISDECENPKGANIVMLGALAKYYEPLGHDVMKAGIANFFAFKGKNNPKNETCFTKGYEEGSM